MSKLITVVFFVIAIVITININKFEKTRIERFFVSRGYKRKLIGFNYDMSERYYGWVKYTPGTDLESRKIVLDKDIEGMSIKQIKEKYGKED